MKPTFISESAELADAMEPSAKDAADWLVSVQTGLFSYNMQFEIAFQCLK